MSSTNKTVNYELSQFIETDKPGWLTDYNSDMRKIDSNLKSVSDVANGASDDLSDLTDRVSTAESAITTNTNNITSLDARTDSLEAQAQASATAITNLQTEQTTQNLGIEAATKLGYNIARPYDAASTYAVGDYVLFQNTLYKCITAIPVGEEFVPAKWLAIKVMDEVDASDGNPIQYFNNDNPLFTGIVTPSTTDPNGTFIKTEKAFVYEPHVSTIAPTNLRFNTQVISYKKYRDHAHIYGSIQFVHDRIPIDEAKVVYEHYILNFDPTKIELPQNTRTSVIPFTAVNQIASYAHQGYILYNRTAATMTISHSYVRVNGDISGSSIEFNADIF